MSIPLPIEAQGALPLSYAEPCVDRLLAHMRDAPLAERVELAGAVRRRCAHVAVVDVLAVSAHPDPVRRHFAAFQGAEAATIVDATRASLRLECGLRADLRIVPRRCFGATLQYLTGSAAHNMALRQLGLERNVRLSEYGVFRLDHTRAGARRIGGQHEEDAYAALGIQYIPPELREGRGEIAAAQAHALPTLVTMADVRGDVHLTASSRATVDGLRRLLAGCAELGYRYCAVSLREPASRASGDDMRALPARLREAARDFPTMTVLHALHRDTEWSGVETGMEPDLTIVSAPEGARGIHATDALLRVITAGGADIVGIHEACDDAELELLARAAAERGVAVELSGGPDASWLTEEQVRMLAESGVQLALTSGAAAPEQLGAIRYAIDRARRGWVQPAALYGVRAGKQKAAPV
jgi:DNA polymerase (family X)